MTPPDVSLAPARPSLGRRPDRARRRLPPRLTRSVFADLSIWMVGVGVVIGTVFPPMLLVFGVPRDIVVTPFFIAVCLLAGIVVGGVNIHLTRVVVMPRLRALVDGMRLIESVVEEATYTGDWSHCHPETCQLPVDSDDVIGESAQAFNHLFRVLQHSHAIEESVAEFSKTMTSQLELKPLCEGALSGFIAATKASAGAIVADVGGELSVLASFGIVEPARLCENDQVRLALQTQQSTYVELPEGVSMSAGLVDFQPREVAFMPLVVRSSATGVVVLAGSTPFERDSRSLSQIFARTFVVALSNAMTHDNLQRVAALDPLTSCYNRRFGLARLEEECLRAVRSESHLGLIMFDIDRFKAVNDAHGHLIGDRVLARVADTAKQQLRGSDVLLRYGGEEFLCVLPGAAVQDTRAISERMRRAVECLEIQDRDEVIRCTISLGYGSFRATDADDATAMIAQVDEALYRAKDDGRNRSAGMWSAGPRRKN